MVKLTGGTYFLNPLTLEYPILEWIETALAFCDEVVLVDMGCTDNTIPTIQQQFGDKVSIVEETWQFARDYHEGIPRNKVLEVATGDWIYLADTDEILHENDYAQVRKIVETTKDAIVRLPQKAFWGSCNLVSFEKREKPNLIKNNEGLSFGPIKGKAMNNAHTLLYAGRNARKSKLNHRRKDIFLYDYSHVRSLKAREISVEFYVKQCAARTGKEIATTSSVLAKPTFPNSDFGIWNRGHPKIMEKWVQDHHMSNGWEV